MTSGARALTVAVAALLVAGCSAGSSPSSDATDTVVVAEIQGLDADGSPLPSVSFPPTTPAPASPTPLPPPYVASATWVTLASGRSLRVAPTAAGRHTPGGDAEAWAEVRALAPDADTPGMEAQFACHWDYARIAAPDKPTWNLEPWRPVVGADEMVRTRCNPGGADE